MAAKIKKRDIYQEELEQLRNNRYYRFEKLLGKKWPKEDIDALVRSEHHPTALENLLKNNCPPRTAVRILI